MKKKWLISLSIIVLLIASGVLVSILIKPSKSFFELTLDVENNSYEVGDEVDITAKFINHSFGTYIGSFHPDKIVFLIYKEGTNPPEVNLPAANYIVLPFGTMKVECKYTVFEVGTYIITALCGTTIEGENYDLRITELIEVE
ncbi:MAG: hypothetical protein JXC31_06360 [Acholeplasmataceae bacterium]|nr:hypothetical protein [Acholeplasmataceae bacterium]MBN2696505.1 hypothetical protein [Bacilli bacterium]